jgi:hypothetical protein
LVKGNSTEINEDWMEVIVVEGKFGELGRNRTIEKIFHCPLMNSDLPEKVAFECDHEFLRRVRATFWSPAQGEWVRVWQVATLPIPETLFPSAEVYRIRLSVVG